MSKLSILTKSFVRRTKNIPMSKPRILIIGAYGSTNLGDSAVLKSIVDNFPIEADITVLSHDPVWTSKMVEGVQVKHLLPFGKRSLLAGTFWQTIRVIRQADYVILGGGTLFQDDDLLAPVLWWWQLLWVNLFKKRVFVYGIGIGPLRRFWSRYLAKRALSKVEVITVRDKASEKIAQKMKLEAKIVVTADPVFLYKATKRASGKDILVSLRTHYGNNPRLLDEMAQFILSQRAVVNLVPFQVLKNDDRKMLGQLQDKIKNRRVRLLKVENLKKLEGMYQRSGFVLGMRLHSIVWAIIYQCPFVALVYTDKVRALLKDCGLSSWGLDIGEVKTEILQEKFLLAFSQRAKLEQVLKKQKEKAALNNLILRQWLKS